MPRLHAGHDAEFVESRHIFPRNHLDVHELVAAVTYSVDVARMLECIEGDPNAAVADRVNENLKPL